MNDRAPWIVVLVALCVISSVELSGDEAAYLFLMVATAFLLFTERARSAMSPASFVVIAYVLGFPLPYLLRNVFPDVLSFADEDVMAYGMVWALRGFSAFALAYCLVSAYLGRFGVQVADGNAPDPTRLAYARFVMACIGFLSLAAWALSTAVFGISLTFIEEQGSAADPTAESVEQVLDLLSNLRYAFFVGFLTLLFRRQATKLLTLVALALVAVTVAEIVIIGSKAAIILGVVSVLLAMMIASPKVTAKHIVAGVTSVVAVYLSFSLITEYRQIMQENFLSGGDVFDASVQVQSFGEALAASVPFAEQDASRLTSVDERTILSRFGSGLFSLANLLEFTERESPLENALENFLIPVYSVLPRALVPERAIFFASGIAAERYYGWRYGGVSVSTIGSFYYAWGYLGIVLGMAALGGIFAYVAVQVRRTGIDGPRWLVLLVILLLGILDVGATFQSVITNFIRVAVMLWFIWIAYLLLLARSHGSWADSASLAATRRGRGN